MLFGQRLFMCSFLPKVGSRSKSSCRELANEPNHEFGRAVWKQNITVALTSFEVSDSDFPELSAFIATIFANTGRDIADWERTPGDGDISVV